MKNIIRFVLGLVLFSIPAIRPLVPTRWLNTYNMYLIPISILLFVLHEFSLIWRPAVPKDEVCSKLEFFLRWLGTAKERVYEQISKCNLQSGITLGEFRINVMLPIKRKFFLARQRMKIFYYSDVYTEEELNVDWYKGKTGSGTCGEAWKLGNPVIFDSRNPNYQRPEKRLNPKQKAVARLMQINSVLSFPIWELRDQRIIGVLNLDSNFNVDSTAFDKMGVIEQGLIEARQLAYVLTDQPVAI